MSWDGQNRISIINKKLGEVFRNNNATNLMHDEDEYGDMTELEEKADYFYFYPECAYYSFYPENDSEITSNFIKIIKNDIESFDGWKQERADVLKAVLNDIEKITGEIDSNYEYVSWLYETNSEYALYEYDEINGINHLTYEDKK